MKQCTAYPGADVDSDHNLIIVKTELKLKTLNKNKIKIKLILDELKQEDIRMKLNKECNNANNNHCQEGFKSIENSWNKLKQTLKENVIYFRFKNE